MPLCPEVKYVNEFPEMNDLGIGDHSGEAFPIRPLLLHPSPAYTLGACHILRDVIAHEYRLVGATYRASRASHFLWGLDPEHSQTAFDHGLHALH
jgi:hypothetical protein